MESRVFLNLFNVNKSHCLQTNPEDERFELLGDNLERNPYVKSLDDELCFAYKNEDGDLSHFREYVKFLKERGVKIPEGRVIPNLIVKWTNNLRYKLT